MKAAQGIDMLQGWRLRCFACRRELSADVKEKSGRLLWARCTVVWEGLCACTDRKSSAQAWGTLSKCLSAAHR